MRNVIRRARARRIQRWFLFLCCAAAGAAIFVLETAASAATASISSLAPSIAATAPAPDTTRLRNAKTYLTWHAPYGQPGASDEIAVACGDTTVKDTLFMCFDPGEDIEAFQSFTAGMYFWAAAGDSLDPHWNFGEGRSFTRLVVQFAPQGVPGAEPAFPASAFSGAGYSTSSASGKLRMIAAGPAGQGWPMKGGTIYVAARLLVPRPALKSKRCDRPMCIEWSTTLFGIGAGRLPEVKAGQRFVSWNSKGGKVCATMKAFAAPPPWEPRTTLPPGWKGR